jgi:hypothetical protein
LQDATKGPHIGEEYLVQKLVKNKVFGSWKSETTFFGPIIDYGFLINDAEVNGGRTRILQFLI